MRTFALYFNTGELYEIVEPHKVLLHEGVETIKVDEMDVSATVHEGVAHFDVSGTPEIAIVENGGTVAIIGEKDDEKEHEC